MPYTIATPVSGQIASASLFGVAVKNAITDLDLRISALESFTNGKPAGRITQQAAQSIADNVGVAITFAAGDAIDTHGFHDPAVNNTRVTPTLPGVYRFRGVVYMDTLTTIDARACWFRKNGSTALPPGDRKGKPVNAIANSMSCEILIDMNGSSDYMELLGFQDNTASSALNTVIASQFASHMEWEYVRALP